MSRTHGRSLKGKRLKMPVPLNKGKRMSLIGAIGLSGFQAALFGEWSTNTEIFLHFIEQQLVPTLQRGDIVIMDNLRVHQHANIKKSIEAVGAQLIFLPPYSPDLSPIEPAWSKIKSYLRKKAARTVEDLQHAICEAFQAIHLSDIAGWFTHCGYSIHSIQEPL